MCALFASTFPERCEQLILFTPYETASGTDEERMRWITDMRDHWGERAWMETFAEGISPVYRRDPSLMDWFVWMQRAAASPGAATLRTMQMETDLTDVTPTIKVPTLVVHRSEDRAAARAFAERLPDGSSAEISGHRYDPYEHGRTDRPHRAGRPP